MKNEMKIEIRLKSQFDMVVLPNIISYDVEEKFLQITQEVNKRAVFIRFSLDDVLSFIVEGNSDEIL